MNDRPRTTAHILINLFNWIGVNVAGFTLLVMGIVKHDWTMAGVGILLINMAALVIGDA